MLTHQLAASVATAGLILIGNPIAGIAEISHAAELRGMVVRVTNGDSFIIRIGSDDIRVLLCGVKSPERREPGHRAALARLRDFIDTQTVICRRVESGTPCDGVPQRTNGSGIVAQCFVNDKDVAAEMVCSGQAVDVPEFSRGYYEQKVRCSKANLKCVIKGNINSGNHRIYYLPTTPGYTQVVIDTARGERWFCTKEEAEGAGWRSPPH